MTCPPEPAPAQLDPGLLPPSDQWLWSCPYCPATTQGGRAGLTAHLATVHPGAKR